jgi:hypothetical protein
VRSFFPLFRLLLPDLLFFVPTCFSPYFEDGPLGRPTSSMQIERHISRESPKFHLLAIAGDEMRGSGPGSRGFALLLTLSTTL